MSFTNSSKGALLPLNTRKVHEYQVLHITGDLLSDEGIIERARKEILRWAQKRSGGRFPEEAAAGRNFEFLAAGRNTSAVEVNYPDINAWALRQEDPDKVVPGRIWTCEAILWRAPEGSPKFATRLSVGSNEGELEVTPAVPGYVRQIVDNIGLMVGTSHLSSIPWYIGDYDTEKMFLECISDPARRLPLVVFSAIDKDDPHLVVDLDKIAAGLCGLAVVCAILPETSWALTQRYGKRLSVFDRAARIYMPGFSEDADQHEHPLWLGKQLEAEGGAVFVDRQIRNVVASFSTRAIRVGKDIIPFAQLRSLSRQAEQDRLEISGASDSEKLLAAEARIAALAKELTEAQALEHAALEEEQKAQVRAREAESRERGAIAQVQTLLLNAQRSGFTDTQSPLLPSEWSEFEAWCSDTLVGRVALAAAAKRGCKKALFNDIHLAARCLLWLANVCRSRLMEGGGSLRDESVEEGIRNSPCGSDEFDFEWRARRISASWHVKTGGNSRAPENCLRIYYGWDDQSQQIIVADMPAHRKTGAS